MSAMRVAFRVDASARIGSGHVMRCLALASAVRSRGGSATFISREHPGSLCDMVQGRGIPVSGLPLPAAPVAAAGASGRSFSPVDDWRDDANLTVAAIGAAGAAPDWLVVDHYGLDAGWERMARSAATRILVIDDLADREHDCDLLLDQNLVAGMQGRYDGLLPGHCRKLLGPAYALLRGEYAALHMTAKARTGLPRRILGFFGGADEQGMSGRFLEAIRLLDRPDIAVDVVLPFGDLGATRGQEPSLPNVRLHANLGSLASLIADADVAVGAGGTSNWERLCLGLPSLVVATAENQRAIVEELDRRGLVRYLGWHAQVDATTIAARLADALRSPNGDWSRRCLAAVDGFGAARAASVLAGDGAVRPRLRACGANDEALLLQWANDAETRANAFNGARIAAAEHAAWFREKLSSESCRMFLLEDCNGEPVAQARFDRQGRDWTISYSVAPGWRGRGIGRRALAASLEHMAANEADGVVLGKVKAENIASRRIFEALGFSARQEGHVVEFRRALWEFRRDADR